MRTAIVLATTLATAFGLRIMSTATQSLDDYSGEEVLNAAVDVVYEAQENITDNDLMKMLWNN